MFRRHLPVRPGVQVETVQKKNQKGHSAKGGSMRSKADPVVSRGRGTSDSLANCGGKRYKERGTAGKGQACQCLRVSGQWTAGNRIMTSSCPSGSPCGDQLGKSLHNGKMRAYACIHRYAKFMQH
jgi:hypothetical protein